MAYYNPYFEDKKNPDSCLNYTYEQFLDMKPPAYFLALLRHNYIWTKRENLDTFAMRVSPSFIFWHDRLVDIYPVSYLQDFYFEMMDTAGLLNEPVMLFIEWARTLAPNKIKTEHVQIQSEEEEDRKAIIIPPDERKSEQVWDSEWIEQDKKMFARKFDLAPDMFQIREVPGVLQQNPNAPIRWLRFLVFNPKPEY